MRSRGELPSDGFPFRVVSLSHVNDPASTPIFPGDPPFTIETAASLATDGYYLQYVRQGEHTGTHWSAPAHFHPTGRTADQLEPADLCLPAVVLDVRERAAADADFALTVADLERFEQCLGPIPTGAAVILQTGWDTRWGTPGYAGIDADGVRHQPGFAPDAVRWLIEHGRLAERGALGTDTCGPDLGRDSTYASSKLLHDRRRISLENLTNLAALPETGAFVLVGGTINRSGSGSPATVFGLVPHT